MCLSVCASYDHGNFTIQRLTFLHQVFFSFVKKRLENWKVPSDCGQYLGSEKRVESARHPLVSTKKGGRHIGCFVFGDMHFTYISFNYFSFFSFAKFAGSPYQTVGYSLATYLMFSQLIEVYVTDLVVFSFFESFLTIFTCLEILCDFAKIVVVSLFHSVKTAISVTKMVRGESFCCF